MPQKYSAREMLEKLVSFPTISSESNLPLIHFVRDYLADHGVESHLVPDETGEKASLYALIGPNVAGGVVLSGHTDVVPVEGQDWVTDPFVVTEKDGKLFGRGTCDMKGFNAIGLSLVPEMLAADLKRPIQIALSYDEEVGCLGAPPMIADMGKTLPQAAAVIVGEPSMMQVVTGHKGIAGFVTTVHGFEVHSSLIHTGVSAVMTAARLINWHSDRMAENRAAADPNSPFVPPYTTLHCGVINGGTASNITAKECTFTTDIRAIPSDDLDDWMDRYRAECARVEGEIKAIHPDARIVVDLRSRTSGLMPETDGAAETLARRLTGDNGDHVVSYATEGGQFQEGGHSVVVCGPGSINQAHQPNEFLSLDQLAKGEKFIKDIIETLKN
ncbi:MAG: acetylornithine deacetylase [Rhodobacteraceae bacterium]|nr:acetylornithine deacetylase [Paracoccaceae bacterium]